VRLVNRLQTQTGEDPVGESEAVRRRLFALVFISLLIPLQIYFTIETAMEGEVVHAWFNGAFAAALVAFGFLVQHVRKPLPLYYVMLVIAVALFTYLLSDADGGVGRLFWLFVFVPIATIVAGRWGGSALAAAFLLLVHAVRSDLVPWGLTVTALDFFRFVFAYVILGVLTHVAEFAREQTHSSLLRKHSALVRANAEIRRLSITDALTGTYNRQFMADRLPAEIARARRYDHNLAVLMCDVDRFKVLNDTVGHPAGDALLREVSERLKTGVRRDVDWIARYGGEEFLIVLPETDVDRALVVGERLRKRVEEIRVPWGTTELRCTASFGAAEAADAEWTSEKLVHAADRSLYLAKKQGRNRVVAGSRRPPETH
jgi:diguanylate cyclase (GGDEF)-like protein